MSESGVAPNHTLYVNRINERIRTRELVRTLYEMFSPFGKILDVKASRSLKKRGQAFIVFEDVQSASRAMKEMQGYPLFNKSIVGSS